jgi:YkoY family integral membrane protein
LTLEILATIGMLVLLEALLSADNALVLAIIAKRLTDKKAQSRALTIGVALSFVMRAAGLLVAKTIIHLWYLRGAGALYLLYLCAAHFLKARKHETSELPQEPTTVEMGKAAFRNIVIALALTDAAFAIDSILVAVAMTDNIWVIYTGVGLGIIALRFVSGFFLKLLERYPALDHAAYALVGWAGVRLMSEAIDVFGETVYHQHWGLALPDVAFWVGMGAIIVLGTVYAVRKRPA